MYPTISIQPDTSTDSWAVRTTMYDLLKYSIDFLPKQGPKSRGMYNTLSFIGNGLSFSRTDFCIYVCLNVL